MYTTDEASAKCDEKKNAKCMKRTRFNFSDPVLSVLNALLYPWQYVPNRVSIVFQYHLWVLPAVY
jgi:hypothetical protein